MTIARPSFGPNVMTMVVVAAGPWLPTRSEPETAKRCSPAERFEQMALTWVHEPHAMPSIVQVTLETGSFGKKSICARPVLAVVVTLGIVKIGPGLSAFQTKT